MFYSTDVRHERFWRVGIARNAVFFRSFAASKTRKGSSEKNGSCEGSAAQDGDKICTTPARESDSEVKIVKAPWVRRWSFAKFAPRLRARAIRKPKSLKHRGFGALLEIDLDKNCTTPARESDFDEKTAPRCMFGALFGSWAPQNLHHACARERFGSQNR